MFQHVFFEMGRIRGRIAAQFATVEPFPVMQNFLGIFFRCHCFHLQGMFVPGVGGKVGRKLNTAILANWRVCVLESESYQIVEISELRMRTTEKPIR